MGAVGQPLPLHRLPEHREVRACGRRASCERGGDRNDRRSTRSRSAGSAPAASASRTTASSAARATTSTTSCCPACSTWRSCGARSRTPGSSRSTPARRGTIPGVRLVMTGEMMASRNLAWMPTLSYDTQAVLATDKVRFQGQEVACVIADDPYIAKDGCEAIVVDYEPLPVIVNPTAGDGGGRSADPRRQGEPARQRRLRLGGRRQGGHRPGVRAGRPDLQARAALPALAPVADRVLRVDRRLQPGDLEAHRVHDHAGAAHHPRRGGAGGRAAGAHDPDRLARHRRRVRQQGAGVSRLRRVDPGVDPARASGQVDRGQDRQPDLDRLRPRRVPARRAGAAQGRQDPRRPDAHRRRPRRVLLRRPAEQVQDRADALGVRLLRHPGRAPDGAWHVHQQGAGRRGLPLLVPGHRGDVLPGADGPGRGRRPRDGPGRVPPHQLRARRRLPAPHPVRLPHRFGPVRQVPRGRARGDRVPRLPQAEGGGRKSGADCSGSGSRR